MTDRKHLSFVPPDPKKITIEKVVLAGRVASETSFRLLINDVRIGRLILGIRK